MEKIEFRELKAYFFLKDVDYPYIGKLLNVSSQTISNKLNGDNDWKYSEMMKLKEHFNMTKEEFEKNFKFFC